jgi:hypothetical protein
MSTHIPLSANNYQHSIFFFQQLAAEAKKDFPDLTDNDIEIITVTFSGYNQGFWGIRFPLPDNTKHSSYQNMHQLDFHYLVYMVLRLAHGSLSC